jgi:Zn-finger nucleic acid-binding protein
MSSSPSKLKCVPLKPPLPSKFQGDLDKVLGTPVPEFSSLANFPVHEANNSGVDLPDGMRCCVMCGQACLCGKTGGKSSSSKTKGSGGVDGLSPRNGNTITQDYDNKSNAIIPTQNKGLCTLCDVNVWVVVTTGLEIKWCKGCKNFRPWAAFGDKGLATKCLRCRERQKEKYRLQKEEKEYAAARSVVHEKCLKK